MDTTQDFTSWLYLCEKRQETINTGWVEKTLNYLLSARTPNEGWGAFPRESSELVYSALVVRALASFNTNDAIYNHTEVATFFKKLFLDQQSLKNLKIDDLCNLITVINVNSGIYKDDINKLIAILEEKILQNNQTSITTLANVLSTLLYNNLVKANIDFTKQLIEKLLNFQNVDGGWPTNNPNSSPLQSSLVLNSFIELKNNNCIEVLYPNNFLTTNNIDVSVSQCYKFLQNSLQEKGWDNITKSTDAISIALILRALGKTYTVDYKIINEGIELLFKHLNPDGSWGLKIGISGNIESTAMCFISLIEIGENKYIPANLARVSIKNIDSELRKITEERNSLQNNIDRRVREQISQIIIERDKLLEQNKRFNEQKDKLEKLEIELEISKRKLDIAKLQEQREYESLKFNPYDLVLDIIIPTISLFIGGYILYITYFQLFSYTNPNILIKLIIYSWGITFVLISIPRYLALFRKYPLLAFTRKLQQITYLSPTARLRNLYLDAATKWDLEIKEDFVYNLFRYFIDVPPDIGYRHAQELITKLHVSDKDKDFLSLWIQEVLSLDINKRKLLFEQLRRGTLN